jgi:hypothetical protein
MSQDWYSGRSRSRFSREHREQLPTDAYMIDVDGLLWAPYTPDTGEPIMIIERKPEQAYENGWFVTQALAAKAGLPAAQIVELLNGHYRVYIASDRNGYQPVCVGTDLTIEEYYERIERPLRERRAVKKPDIQWPVKT